MPRIRSVKPEFFRHEKLQALGPLSMLIFEGLWTQCDKAGRFPWRPRSLKLDILPFIDFDMEKELLRLADGDFVQKYEVKGEFFGVIPTFGEHQRVSGKEAQEPAKYPDPNPVKSRKSRKLTGEAPEKQPGSDWEPKTTSPGSNGAPCIRNGVQEGNGVGASRFTPPSLDEIRDYCSERKNRVDPEKFHAHYESNGWRVGKVPMRKWKAAVVSWERNSNGFSPKEKSTPLSDQVL